MPYIIDQFLYGQLVRALFAHMDRSAILSHMHSSLYDIPLHVRTRHCGQSVLLPRTFIFMPEAKT